MIRQERSTYVYGDSGHKHGRGQCMEKLSPSIDAQYRKLLVGGIHHLGGDMTEPWLRGRGPVLRLLVTQDGLCCAIVNANLGMPISIGDFGPCSPFPGPAKLPRPPSDTDGGEKSPIGDEKRPGPPVPAFREPASDPYPRISPVEQPLYPESNKSTADGGRSDVETGGQRLAIQFLLVRMAETMRGSLGDFARQHEEWRK
jgi:hypothetical protein